MISVDDLSIPYDEQIYWKGMKIGNCYLDKMERLDPLFELVVDIVINSSSLSPLWIEDLDVVQGITFPCKDYMWSVTVGLSTE